MFVYKYNISNASKRLLAEEGKLLMIFSRAQAINKHKRRCCGIKTKEDKLYHFNKKYIICTLV